LRMATMITSNLGYLGQPLKNIGPRGYAGNYRLF
jgi:hypothetical protein